MYACQDPLSLSNRILIQSPLASLSLSTLVSPTPATASSSSLPRLQTSHKRNVFWLTVQANFG